MSPIDFSQARPVVSPEMLEARDTAQRLLQQTDWYVIREMETGRRVPEDIARARAEARLILSA
jgi:hypothetical protein